MASIEGCVIKESVVRLKGTVKRHTVNRLKKTSCRSHEDKGGLFATRRMSPPFARLPHSGEQESKTNSTPHRHRSRKGISVSLIIASKNQRIEGTNQARSRSRSRKEICRFSKNDSAISMIYPMPQMSSSVWLGGTTFSHTK